MLHAACCECESSLPPTDCDRDRPTRWRLEGRDGSSGRGREGGRGRGGRCVISKFFLRSGEGTTSVDATGERQMRLRRKGNAGNKEQKKRARADEREREQTRKPSSSSDHPPQFGRSVGPRAAKEMPSGVRSFVRSFVRLSVAREWARLPLHCCSLTSFSHRHSVSIVLQGKIIYGC